MFIENLKIDIEKRRLDRLRSKCTVYPKNNPTASSLEECTRKMVLEIVHWKDKPVFEPEVMARLEEGNRQESYVIRELMEIGFTITENNPPPFEILSRDKKVIMRGKIDGKIEINKNYKIPFEIKSMNPNIYDRINTIDDFNNYFWTKKYLLQMQSYLYANNEEHGLFICTDMQGHWKIFTVSLDMVEMEKILQKCEQVVAARDGAELPDFHNDKAVCRRCWLFKKHCFPGVDFGEGVQVVDDDELLNKLNRRQELAPMAKEFEVLDKSIKDKAKDNYSHAICGNFELVIKPYTINYKAKEAYTLNAKKVEISRIDQETTVDIN